MNRDLTESIKLAMNSLNPREAVESYLFKINEKMGFNNRVTVELILMQDVKIVRFYDKDGHQLKTTGEMVFYMETGENIGITQ